MSISEEQREKFGDTCKWLDYDSSCHMTLCLLNRARRDILFDRFRELNLNLKYTYYIFNESCINCQKNYECFVKNTDVKNKLIEDNEDGFLMTEFEKEAEEIVKEELKDDEVVRALYLKGKKAYIEELKDKISKLNIELETLEKEI